MINRLSQSRLGNISFIALVMILYFVPRSLRSLVTKYDIIPQEIKLITPRPSCDDLLYTYIPFPNSEYLKKSIGYNGAKLWNGLPNELKNAESIVRFNSLLLATSLL